MGSFGTFLDVDGHAVGRPVPSVPPMSSTTPLVRAVIGAALAILAGLGASLLLARFGRQRLMRWPAAMVIAAAVVVAVVVGTWGWR